MASRVGVMRSPAAERNKEPILQVLKENIPQGHQEGQLLALEIASGTGQHAVYFADGLPHVTWQPSECAQDYINSIRGYIQSSGRTNVVEPVWINTTEPPTDWAGGTLGHKQQAYDIIVCINMCHISEWASSEGLFKGCGYYLKNSGLMFLYGPFAVNGKLSPDSNVRFDAMLKQQNSDWGLRDTREIEKLAQANGLVLEKMVDMPANNKTLSFKKKFQSTA